MKTISLLLVIAILLSASAPAWTYDNDSEDSGGGSGGALSGMLLGGLLGGGVGTAIGSASGNAGKGALIGAGIGAVGGALMGANQSPKQSHANTSMAAEPESGKVVTEGSDVPAGAKIKKRVVKEYDKEGNLISEKEVKN